MKKRDRRLTLTSSTLAAGWSEAVHREGTELKADTAYMVKVKKEKVIDDSTKFDKTMQKGIYDTW